MVSDLLFGGDCACPACERMRRMQEGNPSLPWADPHKYDYLHGESHQDWTYKEFCQCGLCRGERQRQQVRA